MPLASRISRLNDWFKRWRSGGATAPSIFRPTSRSSSHSSRNEQQSEPPFYRWYVRTDEHGFYRVVEDRTNRVVAAALMQKEAAEMMALHNARDPIQSYEDWLHAKAS